MVVVVVVVVVDDAEVGNDGDVVDGVVCRLFVTVVVVTTNVAGLNECKPRNLQINVDGYWHR